MVVKWKKQLLGSSSEMFVSGKGLAPDPESEFKALQSKIGEIMCSLRGCGAARSREKCYGGRKMGHDHRH